MANFLTTGERGFTNAFVDVSGMGEPVVDIATVVGKTPVDIWKSQPSVRKVIDFIASNIAAIPLHAYERSDEGRVRVRDTDLARLLAHPSPAREETPYLFWKRVLIDWLLWDRAAVKIDETNARLLRIPPQRWKPSVNGHGLITKVKVVSEEGLVSTFKPDEFLLYAGYSGSDFSGISPMDTLHAILKESAEALKFRSMMWRRQATHTGVVERDKEWDSAESRTNFLAGLRAFDLKSERSGGTMLLDEGMVWKDRKPSFKPSDLEDIEARKLTDVEVCSLFHIAPEMLGVRAGNYSNMEAFRQSLYRDNLGPYIEGWVQALHPLITTFTDAESPDTYIEAFLDAKLKGSFEEQAKTFQTSVGAPVMTRNEARAKMNLPNVDGGDELITPLNVMIGGQASPTDSGSQNEKGVKGKSWKTASPALADIWAPETLSELERFFARQERSVTAKVKAQSWWDADRWDADLAEVFGGVAKRISGQAGPEYASQLGFDPSLYSAPRTYAYLEAVSMTRARWVNAKTLAALEEAQLEGVPFGDVYAEIRQKRSRVVAAAFAAAVAGWVAEETGRQLMPGRGYKRWIVTSSRPRSSHAALNGETVPIGKPFSNGAQWPGDPASGVDEVAGCMCGVEIERVL